MRFRARKHPAAAASHEAAAAPPVLPERSSDMPMFATPTPPPAVPAPALEPAVVVDDAAHHATQAPVAVYPVPQAQQPHPVYGFGPIPEEVGT